MPAIFIVGHTIMCILTVWLENMHHSGLELKCPPALLQKTRKIFATHFGEL